MKTGTITIKEVATAEELRQAQQIREEVLEAEQGFAHDVNIDGLDESASHVLALDAGAPVATARLTIHREGEGKIARIAVLRPYRGKGVGQRMLRQLEAIARLAGLGILHVQPHARLESFFRSLGYERMPGSAELGGYQLIHLRKNIAV